MRVRPTFQRRALPQGAHPGSGALRAIAVAAHPVSMPGTGLFQSHVLFQKLVLL